MKYILDTSVLVDDPNAIYRFTNSEVIIPIVVLEELDKLKKHAGEAGKNARVAIKLLDELSFNKDFKGIQLKDGITLSVLIDPKTKEYGDNRILDVAKSLKKECTIVSNDFNLRIRARALGMKAESYQSTSNATYGVYLGMREWNDPSLAAELNAKTYIEASEVKDAHENEFIIFDANTIGRKTKDKIKLVNRKYPWGLTPRSIEQTCAIDLLMDPDIKLVTLIGKAGSGKSLISLAAALEQTVNKKEYTKSIVYRLAQAVGSDLGFLPGPQPLDAKIATPNGWTTMGELSVGSKVISRDGKPTNVLGIFPKGTKSVYKVTTTDGTSTECCEDHLWYTFTANSKGSIKSTKEIIDTLLVDGNVNHFLPRNEPVEYNEQEALTDPYLFGKNCYDKYTLYFVEPFVPDNYKFNSIKNRMEFLKGFIDVHGSISDDGEIIFTTILKHIGQDVIDIIRSLGGTAKRVNSDIIARLPDRLIGAFVQNLKETCLDLCGIKSIEYVGEKEVQCIKVDNEEHLYLTNDFIVTHNTKQEKLEPWFQAIYDSFEVLLSKGKSTEWRKQLDYFVEKKQCIELDAITYIRGRSMPNSFILLDEAQNSSKDEIKTLLTRAGAGTKIVLTGDIEQIDRSDLDALNNGITHVIDKFKDSSLAGHITLLKGERSELANEAANIL
jgi:predicted ribonuclease YlaK